MNVDSDHTDAKLLRLSARRPECFGELFGRHSSDIHRWFLGQRLSESDALERTAEVFARAWMAKRRFKPPASGSAGPWLQGIAQNVHRDFERAEWRQRTAVERLGWQRMVVSPSAEEHLIREIDSSISKSDVSVLLARLPDDQREAVEKRVLMELSYEAIAKQMNCTQDLVRMRVMRGLRAIGSEIKGFSYEQ